jgi:hypothetical protein
VKGILLFLLPSFVFLTTAFYVYLTFRFSNGLPDIFSDKTNGNSYFPIYLGGIVWSLGLLIDIVKNGDSSEPAPFLFVMSLLCFIIGFIEIKEISVRNVTTNILILTLYPGFLASVEGYLIIPTYKMLFEK